MVGGSISWDSLIFIVSEFLSEISGFLSRLSSTECFHPWHARSSMACSVILCELFLKFFGSLMRIFCGLHRCILILIACGFHSEVDWASVMIIFRGFFSWPQRFQGTKNKELSWFLFLTSKILGKQKERAFVVSSLEFEGHCQSWSSIWTWLLQTWPWHERDSYMVWICLSHDRDSCMSLFPDMGPRSNLIILSTNAQVYSITVPTTIHDPSSPFWKRSHVYCPYKQDCCRSLRAVTAVLKDILLI